MRTETIEHTYYKFDELSDSAKQHIYETWRNDDTYHWREENKDSLYKFAEYFDITITDFEYGYHNYCSFKLNNDDIESMRGGVRLWKYLKANYPVDLSGECPFTGYCQDETLLDPIRAFLKYPSPNTDYEALMIDCTAAWVFSCRDDYEHWLTPESIKDDIEANEYEFTESGKLI